LLSRMLYSLVCHNKVWTVLELLGKLESISVAQRCGRNPTMNSRVPLASG
jgi:hypothetical protein